MGWEGKPGWGLAAPRAGSAWVLGAPDCPPDCPQDGIEPMWEDSQNKRGGRWLITLAKQQRHTELDRFWLETVSVGPPGLVLVAMLPPATAPSPSGDCPGLPFSSRQLLCLIGEMFDDYSDEVCGAVINIRAKGDKIALWTRDAENQEGVTHIG